MSEHICTMAGSPPLGPASVTPCAPGALGAPTRERWSTNQNCHPFRAQVEDVCLRAAPSVVERSDRVQPVRVNCVAYGIHGGRRLVQDKFCPQPKSRASPSPSGIRGRRPEAPDRAVRLKEIKATGHGFLPRSLRLDAPNCVVESIRHRNSKLWSYASGNYGPGSVVRAVPRRLIPRNTLRTVSETI